MVCGDSAISLAFGFPWSSRGCVSFLGPRELPGFHPAGCAAGYLMVAPNKCEVSTGVLRLQAIARENFKNVVGQVQRWQCTDSKNVGECRSVGTRDWHWDDLWEERSPIPPTTARFKNALRSLKNGILCGDSAVSKAFGFPGSSRGRISFLGAPVLPRLHLVSCAMGYLMVPPNKCEVPARPLRLQATARENYRNAVG
ncbi:hypothetical protein AXF42_Ash018192 [Apostasia shenzhenica]|uniref:Uncharacterized protein n=1 Tax=Apostasia shenzhenica TaxID=1088818 RepID=A0A2I0B1C1_9ASPA|nr:hypothetical protein AXF42_Ash018192 [Apostasia shenzhenica]